VNVLLERVQVTGSQFADNLVLYVASRTALESLGWSFGCGGRSFGLAVSLPSTKGLGIGAGIDGDDVTPLKMEIEVVSEFTSLGSCLCDDGEATNEVACRIAKAF